MEKLGRMKGKAKMGTEGEAEGQTTAKRSGRVLWGGSAADVLLLVFARLPAASLARVSAVCTTWCVLLLLFFIAICNWFGELRGFSNGVSKV